MITTDNLGKNFGDFTAVDGVDLKVEAGEVLALLGPNGAGKTTTIRMLTSVLKPTRGRAWVAGYDVVSHPKEVRASVGVLTEQHGLYNRMPAEAYLHFYGELYQLDESTRSERINTLLDQFGLLDTLDRKLGEFSKGMRQKLALARALLHDPPVLLLDEPTSAMDPESARLVRDAIRVLRSADRAIVICTHNLAEAEELADRIAIIRQGVIIANDTFEALRRDLLGPEEYQINVGTALDSWQSRFPDDVSLTATGTHWLRFQTPNPGRTNPKVIQSLLDQGLPVISVQAVPRNLEQIYLQAVASVEGGASHEG